VALIFDERVLDRHNAQDLRNHYREGSLTAYRPFDHFACERCGSPSITFPDEIHDAAELHCAGCGVDLGSWYVFKERTRQIILREIHRGEISAACASSDFPIDLLER
jgi:hypothetical protein